MIPTSVHARGVSKKYPGARGVQALQAVDADIGAGRFVSILGPSGCGKSTLLRCIAGLEGISSGTLDVAGQPVAGPPDGVGIVFQQHALLDWRSIRDNIVLPLEFAGKPVARHADKVDHLLQMTGLRDFAASYPRELSGGMRQRAAICRALVDDPPLLLMDEPFGALDALTRDQMNADLQRIWLETRNTVVFVTHGIAEAVFLGDEVLVFSPRPGRVAHRFVIDLPRPRPLAVRETPEFGRYTREIRELFGQMGLLDEAGATAS
ncbi:MAG: ABC transporter ATP-binding protein [Proteobacteria bacterium]|nr:ABC transporter ATP-binding protein [Pseudomonadota bacterium]